MTFVKSNMKRNEKKMKKDKSEQKFGADLIVDSLINHNVKYIFGIPGAKIDKVFDTLVDKGPELIVARHEQNAAFMAQAVGRITGEPGVVITTSGPGASNLATGLVTATAEGDAVLALAGQGKRDRKKKPLHEIPAVGDAMRHCEQGGGRVLVRYSGTEPLARVMVEGPDLTEVEECSARIAAAIEREIG